MSKEGVLWIGSLEPYMTEDFLKNSLSLMGEEDSLIMVKIIRNKYTGALASYGFLQFDTDASALMAMHKLNGKIIPNSQPPVRFQLNHASAKQSGDQYSDREYSVWVSELSIDVTEEEFKRVFATRYESVKTAKLMKEKDGRLFGFLRFGNLNDQKEALIHMNGFHGIGDRPIKVSMAIPKPCLSEASKFAEKQSMKYSEMYENYQSDKSAWTNYGSFQKKPVLMSGNSKAAVVAGAVMDWDLLMMEDDDEDENGDVLIEHDVPVNVDAMNSEFVERSQEVWDAVERDRWIYNLDNDEGIAPNTKRAKKRSVVQAFGLDVQDDQIND